MKENETCNAAMDRQVSSQLFLYLLQLVYLHLKIQDILPSQSIPFPNLLKMHCSCICLSWTQSLSNMQVFMARVGCTGSAFIQFPLKAQRHFGLLHKICFLGTPTCTSGPLHFLALDSYSRHGLKFFVCPLSSYVSTMAIFLRYLEPVMKCM